MEFAFPFAFGLLPSTRGHHGHWLDVLLLTDAELPTGTRVRCRQIGALTLDEGTEGGGTIRNDRLLAVPLLMQQDRPQVDLSDVPEQERENIESFSPPIRPRMGKWSLIGDRLAKEDAGALVREAVQ